MITVYDRNGTGLVKRDGLCAINEATVWIDLIAPTPEEDNHIEQALGVEIPTRAEAREIEASNRM